MTAYDTQDQLQREQVYELACNLDDMTPEDIGYAMERLLEAGALDVYTIPIGMKKNRPATMLCCLCPAGQEERFAALLLRHTTTLGVRMQAMERRTLPRRTVTRQTAWGPVHYKTAGGREKPEYEDLARIAREQDLPIHQIRRSLEKTDGGETL